MRLIDADITIKEIEKVKRIMDEEIIENNRKDLINFVNGLNQSCLCIEQQPTVEKPKGKWIPISERLPKDGQTCLVTVKGFLGGTYCEITTYSNNLYKIDKSDFYDKKNVSGFYNLDCEYGFYEVTEVIAWMPLPTSYKGESEVKE